MSGGDAKTALVTGASRGIGKAIALRLADDGYDVAVGYLMNEGPANAVAEAVQAKGRRALAIQGDVRSRQDLKRIVDTTAEELVGGGLDLVVDSKWDLTMESTLRPLLLLSQYAVPHLQQRGGGRIIALSSLGARRYLPGYAAIGSAKAALENLVRYLAVDLAPLNIRVNCVSGGPIDTDSLNYVMADESDRAEVADATPLGRIGTPEDLSGVVSFLCGPDSDWITGQTLIADGGLSLR